MKSFYIVAAITILLSIKLLCSTVYADTDGSYCIGQGYVAIEARGLWMKAERPTIYIVFAGSQGLSDRIAIDSPADRNRSIHCESERISISDGSIIDLTNRAKPKVLRVETKTKTGPRDDLLPYIGESKALSVPSSDENHLYSLVLSHVEQVPPSGGIILHHVSARVVQSDKLGNLIDARLLAEGIRLETID